jgi:hypothetical protein
MADLVVLHRDSSGEEIMINRDQVLYAERASNGKYTVIKFAENVTVSVAEELVLVRNKPH